MFEKTEIDTSNQYSEHGDLKIIENFNSTLLEKIVVQFTKFK